MNILKKILWFFTGKCEKCGGKIEYDGYKDRCNKCGK